MQSFPYALKLLQLQRPGAMPEWKEKRLRQSGISSILKPLNLSTITDSKLSKIGDTLDSESSWQRLMLNHGYMRDLIDGVVDFRRRDKYRRGYYEQPQLSDILVPKQQWMSYTPPGTYIQLSRTEKFRVINASYMALVLQLQIFGFRPYTSTRKRSTTLTIPDFVSVFSLNIRKCLELIVFIRICIIEFQLDSRNSINSTRKNSRDHSCSGQSPRFCSQHLRQMLASVVNIRYEALKFFEVGGMGPGIKMRSIRRFCPKSSCLMDISHPLRSIFFDVNQEKLSEMFDNLNEQLESSSDPDIRVLRPLPPKSNEEATKEYANSITNLCKRIKMKGKLDFRAVRVDKDGVISFNDKGVIDDESAAGRWGIFRESDLRNLHEVVRVKKALVNESL